MEEMMNVMCEICGKEERKYKCPKCGMSTCSLLCCKQHKTQLKCSGQRDRIQFVASKDFTETHLRRDYHFLEDVLQTRTGAKRNFAALCGQEQAAAKLPARSSLPTMASSQNLNKYAKNIRNFVKAALDRQTTVLLQPSGMSKRKSNTSRYDPQQDLIAWKIMAVFIIKSDFSLSEVIGLDVNSDQMNQTAALQKAGICLQTQVSEKERIADIRSKMLQSVQSGTILRQALKPLIAQMDALVCYLRVLPAQANRPLFRQIASDSSLREAMSGMTVMEFPTLYFGPAAAMERLPVLLHEDTAAALVEDLAPAGEAAVDDSNSACDEEDSNGSEEDVEDGDSSSVSSEEEEAEAVLAAPTSTASSASPALASKKNVSFGGMLIADYSSDSDSEEEEEQPAVVPGASDKYRDFMNQLLAMQGAAQTDAVVMEEGEC